MANNKVALDGKTLLVLMGMSVTLMAMLSSLAVFVFKTEADAAVDHSIHEKMPAHAVQIEVNKSMRATNTAQQKKIDAMYDNVLLIGERVRAKKLKRVVEE